MGRITLGAVLIAGPVVAFVTAAVSSIGWDGVAFVGGVVLLSMGGCTAVAFGIALIADSLSNKH